MGVSTGQPWKKSFRFHEVWYSRCYRDKSCNSQMLVMLRGVWSHAECMLGDLQTSVCHSTTWDANLAMELWWNVSMTLTQDPFETHLTVKSSEISFACITYFSTLPNRYEMLQRARQCVLMPCSMRNFRSTGQLKWMLRANQISRDLACA